MHFRSGRGGRHVEFGLAIAWGKPVYLVGERENVFHWLPQVRVFPALDEVVNYLKTIRGDRYGSV